MSHSLYLDDTFQNHNNARQSINLSTAFFTEVFSCLTTGDKRDALPPMIFVVCGWYLLPIPC